MITTEIQVAKEQLQKWGNALLTQNSDTVSQLYAEDATLKPTLDPEHKQNRAAIKGYFDSFLQKGPQCKLLEDANLRVRVLSEQLILFTGKYEFTLTQQNNDVVIADFVFLYQFNSNQNKWEIIKHSSSLSL
tara:strand:- start:263 stop:658 length:396 start_codon:yes stop_codon:yes gene_type:complete